MLFLLLKQRGATLDSLEVACQVSREMPATLIILSASMRSGQHKPKLLLDGALTSGTKSSVCSATRRGGAKVNPVPALNRLLAL